MSQQVVEAQRAAAAVGPVERLIGGFDLQPQVVQVGVQNAAMVAVPGHSFSFQYVFVLVLFLLLLIQFQLRKDSSTSKSRSTRRGAILTALTTFDVDHDIVEDAQRLVDVGIAQAVAEEPRLAVVRVRLDAAHVEFHADLFGQT